jgi:hypothetical protein
MTKFLERKFGAHYEKRKGRNESQQKGATKWSGFIFKVKKTLWLAYS